MESIHIFYVKNKKSDPTYPPLNRGFPGFTASFPRSLFLIILQTHIFLRPQPEYITAPEKHKQKYPSYVIILCYNTKQYELILIPRTERTGHAF